MTHQSAHCELEEVLTIEEIWERIPTCPGFQTEIINGVLVTGPHGTVHHALINSRLHGTLHETARENGWLLLHSVTLHLEHNRDRVQPDLVVAPATARSTG
jgi:Putative restriction endonuclease